MDMDDDWSIDWFWFTGGPYYGNSLAIEQDAKNNNIFVIIMFPRGNASIVVKLILTLKPRKKLMMSLIKWKIEIIWPNQLLAEK